MTTRVNAGSTWSERRTQVALGVVDVGLLTALITYGSLHHGGDPLGDPLSIVSSVVPFAVGWALAAALAGYYRRVVARNPVRVARLTALCWLAAANVGFLLRETAYFTGGTTAPFPLVMTGIGLLAFVPWRVGYAWVASRTT